MSLSIVLALTGSLNFKQTAFFIMFICLGFHLLWSLVFAGKLTMIISAITAGTAIVAGLIYCSIYSLFSVLLYKLYNLFSWLVPFMQVGGKINSGYALTIVLFLCGIVSMAVYLLTVKRYCFIIVLTLSAGLFVSQWMFGFFLSYTSFYIFIFTVLLYYFRYILSRKADKEPGDYAEKGEFTFLVLPLCLIIFLFAFILPFSKEPIKWPWLDNKIADLYQKMNPAEAYIQFEYFSVASSGFGNSPGKLGGKVKLDNTLVLSIKSSKSLYLKGAVYDNYTGDSWLISDKSQFPYIETQDILSKDIKETFTGIRIFSDDKAKKELLYHSLTAGITYENIRTKTIFLPLKLEAFSPNYKDKSKKQLDANNVLSSKRNLSKGYNYNVSTYNMVYGQEEFINLLKKSKGRYFRELLNKMETVYDPDKSENLNSMVTVIGKADNLIELKYTDVKHITENSDLAYQKFLQLPEKLPDRVKSLAASISANKASDYEKVKSIEQYLSSKFPYTLNASQPPLGRDFVDYFLFDAKQGYCTYYASAMTVMVRSLGIPARYVEGYMLPARPDRDSIYRVTNHNAHAWVEVYFEGFGWIPFEPTAPFRAAFYMNQQNQQGSAAISENFMEDPYYQEYLRHLKDYNSTGMPLTVLPDVTENEDKYLTLKISGSALGLLLVLFLLAIIINYSRNRITVIRIIRMDPRSSILTMAARYFKILSFQGFGLNPGETPSEYAARLTETLMYSFPAEHKDENDPAVSKSLSSQINRSKLSRIQEVMSFFIKAKYSTIDITEGEKKTVLNFNSLLLSKTKSNMGPIKYFFYRYILGAF